MTFNARETGTFSGEPFELYWWSMGATSWYQTSGDTPRTHQGRTYEPAVLSRTEVDQNGEANSGNVTITMELDNPIAQLFLQGSPSQPISLIVLAGHEGETEIGCTFTGRVGSPKFKETCELTCASRQATWKQSIPGLTFQAQCPLRWGSTRCGVDKATWLVMAAISGVSGTTLTSPDFAAKSDGHFRGGWVEWNGRTRMITAHVGALVTLLTPLPDLAPGQTLAAYPGCMGTEADCSGRYNNLANHLGCQRIPSKNPFGNGGIA